jgi:hypothetical protein
VEPGIFSTFPVRRPVVPENGEPNQCLAGQFPQLREPGILSGEPGNKCAESGIKRRGRGPKKHQKETHLSVRQNALN